MGCQSNIQAHVEKAAARSSLAAACPRDGGRVAGIQLGTGASVSEALLRVNEAAELLQVSRWTVYRWLADGRLQGTKLGKGSLRVLGESVSRLIEENRVNHHPGHEARKRS